MREGVREGVRGVGRREREGEGRAFNFFLYQTMTPLHIATLKKAA